MEEFPSVGAKEGEKKKPSSLQELKHAVQTDSKYSLYFSTTTNIVCVAFSLFLAAPSNSCISVAKGVLLKAHYRGGFSLSWRLNSV